MNSEKRLKDMGMGGYIFAEWDSVQKEFPQFQQAFAKLENDMILKTNADWSPRTLGYLTPSPGQYGRTTILPALFDDNTGTQMAHWRQKFTSTGHQTIISGTRAGNTIPEDFKVGWMGLAFPNKEMLISEIKFQIGDRKYGRIDLEELKSYNKPAIVFEEGFTIDEEQSFELYGYLDFTAPENGPGGESGAVYQRIVMLGFCFYKVIDKVLSNPGAAI